MARVLVIGDDLTGVNGTGARFARSELSVATVDPERASGVVDRYDVVVVNTDSRHVDPSTAAARVARAVRAVGPVELVVKRTDSTLRGNVGAEVDAVLREMRALTTKPVRGLVIPAFPEANRVTVDGVQLLDGVPLERTELATDPLNPMRTSVVPDIFAEQTSLPLRHVTLRQVSGGHAALCEALSAGDEPLVLCDAFSDDHIAAITMAAAEVAQRDGTVWVSVDPGPAGAMLAMASGIEARRHAAGPLLAVVGSTTELTRRQLDIVRRDERAVFFDVDVCDLLHGDRQRWEQRVVDVLEEQAFPAVVVLRTARSAEDLDGLDSRDRQRLPDVLAELISQAARRVPISGIYTTGGDVTAAVLSATGAQALEVTDEIVPLAVGGAVAGGVLDGLPVVTKGGLVGDDTTTQDCLRHLRVTVEEQLRRVRSEVPSFAGPAPNITVGHPHEQEKTHD